MILNRYSGLTAPNDSLATVTASTMILAGTTVSSATMMTTTASGTATPLPSSTSDRAATVGVAVGVPLGLALFAFAVMLWRQKREAAGLRKEKEDWEEKYVTLLQSNLGTQRSGKYVPHILSERATRHELEEGNIGELDS